LSVFKGSAKGTELKLNKAIISKLELSQQRLIVISSFETCNYKQCPLTLCPPALWKMSYEALAWDSLLFLDTQQNFPELVRSIVFFNSRKCLKTLYRTR